MSSYIQLDTTSCSKTVGQRQEEEEEKREAFVEIFQPV